jgi:two-component system, OmpR family, sensor histidine kinase SenX3
MLQGWLIGLLGAVLGGGVVLAWRASERPTRPSTVESRSAVPGAVSTVLGVLRSSALVVDAGERVVKASAPAYALGLVRSDSVAVPELAEMIRLVRRDGQIRETELVLKAGAGLAFVSARVAPLDSHLVLALVEDRTRERQVEQIRRDFVANVSHELKTPIGAIRVLAEASADARDDPQAVERFANRMLGEARRLHELVQQIIELSRLQGDELLADPVPVLVNDVVTRAAASCSAEAMARDIVVETTVGAGADWMLGNADEIALAVGNLVANAVAYSPEGGRVTVSATRSHNSPPMIAIAVSDQGIGIASDDLERIFERFYRVDPARPRATGGTGLGLSIVKHVAAAHGGEVKVWSAPGRGSTFTLLVPASHALPSASRQAAPETTAPTKTTEITEIAQ